VAVRLRVGLVEVLAAHRAEPAAFLAADDLHRKREQEGVTRPGCEVERAVFEIRAVQLLRFAGLVHLARVDGDHVPRVGDAAHARAGHRRLEAKAQRVPRQRPRDVEPGVDGPTLDRIGLASELERVEAHLGVHRAALAGAQLKGLEIDQVGALRHADHVSHAPQGAPAATVRRAAGHALRA
jgi:hypothetical protein